MTPTIKLFSQFATDDIELIASFGATRNFKKGVILITEGDQSDSFYVLQRGRVRVFASDEHGHEVTLDFLESGSYFGEIALIDDSPRSASVITTEPCSITVISRMEFERCLDRNPQLSLKLIRYLTEMIRNLTMSVKNLALMDVYGRIARTLAEMSVETENGERFIEQRLTHQDIANIVGSSREMVSRIMKDLTKGDYISSQDKQITIRRKLPLRW